VGKKNVKKRKTVADKRRNGIHRLKPFQPDASGKVEGVIDVRGKRRYSFVRGASPEKGRRT